jgi:hypothetical protein
VGLSVWHFGHFTVTVFPSQLEKAYQLGRKESNIGDLAAQGGSLFLTVFIFSIIIVIVYLRRENLGK